MTASIPPKTIHIVIIGGGIGSLSLAIGLSKYPHLTFKIYESHCSFTEIRAGIGFNSNSHRAMSLISSGLYEGYKSIALFNGKEEKRGVNFQYQVGEKGVDEGKEVIEVLLPVAWSRVRRIGGICLRH
jgi:salicylate hydroxylase